MKKFILCIIGFALLLAVIFVLYGFYRTWKTGAQPEYEEFTKGTLPTARPEGLWKGTAPELGEISWQGKKFDGGMEGINRFKNNGVETETYPFTYFEAKSVGWKDKKVIRLHYGLKTNPLWLRFIVDEMTSVGPNEFLGVVYIKLIPGFPFRMGYFRLMK